MAAGPAALSDAGTRAVSERCGVTASRESDPRARDVDPQPHETVGLERHAVQQIDLVTAHDIDRGMREPAEGERIDQGQVVADVREHQDHGIIARSLECQHRRMPRIEADELAARELGCALTSADQRGQSAEDAAGVGVGIRPLRIALG